DCSGAREPRREGTQEAQEAQEGELSLSCASCASCVPSLLGSPKCSLSIPDSHLRPRSSFIRFVKSSTLSLFTTNVGMKICLFGGISDLSPLSALAINLIA